MTFAPLWPVVGAAAGAFAARVVNHLGDAPDFAKVLTAESPSHKQAEPELTEIERLRQEVSTAMDRFQTALFRTLSRAGMEVREAFSLQVTAEGEVASVDDPQVDRAASLVNGDSEAALALERLAAAVTRLHKESQWRQYQLTGRATGDSPLLDGFKVSVEGNLQAMGNPQRSMPVHVDDLRTSNNRWR